MNKEDYEKIANSLSPKVNKKKNAGIAFLVGGVIGAIGQFFLELYQTIFMISETDATPYMVVTMVFLACVLTGLGVYDKLGAIAGAGSFIPITGFANSMTASAMEGRSEGIVLGIGAGVFKLGGTVITFGIVSSFVLGGIRYVLSYFW
ncbi:SpoVA/SpoVAEb family sporulation membrane protein [Tannockella kyphosi]|uniref:SpoVA/SpoVAEb family sporulation membrane protein n=1 Tax=Tannockella kyphosi TaxID=2899121 RepID=UPI0020133AD4|nr:SpoVA/SpoVAEb family sporulation membrane protein [Tannockella kyphosi]